MTSEELEQLKYPIGKFECPKLITKFHIDEWLSVLETFPKTLEALVLPLTESQLDTQYRPEGWTVRQVIHHLSDSHHNSYTRFKWAMTENNPIIKAYDEQAWANQLDYKAPISDSLLHLKAIHNKLVRFVSALSSSDLKRTFIHPDGNEIVSLEENLGIYAWHSLHHSEHIKLAIKKAN